MAKMVTKAKGGVGILVGMSERSQKCEGGDQKEQ